MFYSIYISVSGDKQNCTVKMVSRGEAEMSVSGPRPNIPDFSQFLSVTIDAGSKSFRYRIVNWIVQLGRDVRK